jgi:hypothetical protein
MQNKTVDTDAAGKLVGSTKKALIKYQENGFKITVFTPKNFQNECVCHLNCQNT